MKTITGKYYARTYIEHKAEFQTQSRNFHARWSGDDYVVWSYSTAIAQWSKGVWYINDTKYSVETAKHQQIVADAIGYRTWRDNAIHVDHLYRGVSNLHARVTGRIAVLREERIKRELGYSITRRKN